MRSAFMSLQGWGQCFCAGDGDVEWMGYQRHGPGVETDPRNGNVRELCHCSHDDDA